MLRKSVCQSGSVPGFAVEEAAGNVIGCISMLGATMVDDLISSVGLFDCAKVVVLAVLIFVEPAELLPVGVLLTRVVFVAKAGGDDTRRSIGIGSSCATVVVGRCDDRNGNGDEVCRDDVSSGRVGALFAGSFVPEFRCVMVETPSCIFWKAPSK